MRWSATRLRWVLLTGVVLLAAVVAGFFGLARYRAGKIWQRILARSGVNLRQETNGFTYSQSSGGRTVFTLHAAKATPLGNNRYALHDAVLILYGREPGRDDRITGNEIEYDQDQGVARAAGEVHMDLQVPEPNGKTHPAAPRPVLAFAPENETAMDPGIIHVRTSGLVYMRKMGLAATGEPAEFRYGGITCTSRGAEFDTGHSMVRLLANVRMTGTVRNAAFTLTAGHAELSRTANTVDVTSPVMSSENRSARAAHALFHLRKDGSVETAEANGAVQLREGTQTVAAPQVTAVFGQENHPEKARLFTGVTYADVDSSKPAQGSAATVDLLWTATGVLNAVTANGAVRFNTSSTGHDGTPLTRHMRAEQAVATFSPGTGAAARKALLQRVHLVGAAELGSRTPARSGAAATEDAVNGDDLTTTFTTGPQGRAVPQRLDATGHTRLEQTAADGARQQSIGDTLQAEFAPAATDAGSGPQVQVSSAVQTGHVDIESWPATQSGGTAQIAVKSSPELTKGHAFKAVYTAATETVTLTGGTAEGRATVEQAQGELTAPEIVVHQGTGDAEASGGVTATSAGTAGQAATHVLASRARLLHATNVSEFYGEAGHPVQLFQGGSQVQATQITLDGKAHSMAARPGTPGEVVQAVFATEPKESAATPRKPTDHGAPRGSTALGVAGGSGFAESGVTAAGRSAVRVSAARMDYDDVHHEAVFAGSVHMRGVMGEVTGEQGAALLKSARPGTAAASGSTGMPDLGGDLDRMVLLGNVRLAQPGRTGTGEQLTYTAATDNIVLTGTPAKPPRVTGEGGSIVTGATLVFGGADSTIVVAGTKGEPKSPGSRVHTETDLKQVQQNH